MAEGRGLPELAAGALVEGEHGEGLPEPVLGRAATNTRLPTISGYDVLAPKSLNHSRCMVFESAGPLATPVCRALTDSSWHHRASGRPSASAGAIRATPSTTHPTDSTNRRTTVLRLSPRC